MSGASAFSAGVDLGDKLHKNFNETTQILGNLRQGDAQIGIDRQKLLIAQQQAAIQKMLDMQKYKANDAQLKWMSDFRNAASRYRG
ncbi:hypothetical protein CCP3SC15_300015 [Gammaproteobacteria bacterium]